MKKQRILSIVLVWTVGATALSSCAPGAGTPSRKKMPGFSTYDGIEGRRELGSGSQNEPTGSFAFTASNVDVMTSSGVRGYLSVPLSDPSLDAAAISLINSVKPFAMPMITAWAQQQHEGVMLDLSAHNGADVHRTDYVMEKANGFSVPVIIIWDNASVGRVNTLKGLVSNVPELSFTQVAGIDPSGK